VPEQRPLRVAVLGRSVYGLHGVGGLERHLFDLVRHHLAEGWHVSLITRTPAHADGVDPARWRPVRDHPRCTVHFVPYRSFPLAGRRGTTIVDRSTAYPWFGRRAGALAATMVRSANVDVVYGVGASVWGYARSHRPGSGAPLVLNPQGLEEFGGIDGAYGGSRLKAVGYAPLRAVVRACARRADAVIATDCAIEPAVRRHLPVSGDRVRTIPNGLDVVEGDRLVDPAAGRTIRAEHGIAGDEPLLLSVGRVEANKGFADLADALACMTASPWRWVLVGDGPNRTSLAARIAALGLSERMRLVGRVDDRTLHAWYDAADLFVHPTRYEGSSLVTLEAMLHRKPVVATRAGGLPDKVLPGQTGWLTEPGDPQALAAALDEAIRARQVWRRFGQAGRDVLEMTFDWRVIQQQFRLLYDELLRR
jgi:glycosyltransferase involved in cell wall biosynthesis